MVRIVSAAVILLCAAPLLAVGSEPDRMTVAKLSEETPRAALKSKAVLGVKEHYQYYDIAGMTAADLRKQMKQNGTKWDDGKVYAALTTWEIQYHYDVSVDHTGHYSIASANTDVDIVFNLPRLKPGFLLPDGLSKDWTNYMESLVVHENGHRDLALKTANEINEALASLGSFSSRRELDKEVKSLTKEKLKLLKEVQVAYDAETHHGETQGALLRN